MGLFGSKEDSKPFSVKVWTATGIILLCLLVFGVFIYTFNVSLLLMAGVVLAVYLRMITDKIKKWTGWKDVICYALSIIITLVLATLLFWLIGARVEDQAQKLKEKLPEMKAKAGQIVQRTPLLKDMAGDYFKSEPAADSSEKITQPSQTTTGATTADSTAAGTNSTVVENNTSNTSSSGSSSGAMSQNSGGVRSFVQSFFKSTFGVLGDLYTVFFLGLFLAATPKEYVNGIVSLIPRRGKRKAREVLQQMGLNLRSWFKGMTYSVLITFALTAAGLLTLGVDMWLVLAISAGLLTFIPNFGPIIALIPAVLVGLLDSPQQALYIAILYILVQTVESNLITPFIQKKMINVPAALLLFFQMLMGFINGGWGVIMATPVLVVLMTIVQELYVGKPKEEKTQS